MNECVVCIGGLVKKVESPSLQSPRAKYGLCTVHAVNRIMSFRDMAI